MLNPRIDKEEIELESFGKHLEELEQGGMENNLNVASLKRYSGPLADHMDSVYEEARESAAVKSNIVYKREDIQEEIRGNKRIIGGIMTDLNEFYSDVVVYDESFRWDVGLIPEVTDQLRKVDGEEMIFEEEAEIFHDIIEEYQPVEGPEVVERFEEKTGYAITYQQFKNRVKTLIEEDVVPTGEGYRLEPEAPLAGH